MKKLKKIDDRYSVGDDGTVLSGGLPLAVIGGTGVNLHGKRMKVCYLVARAFVPNPEGREYVRHRNGDPADNRAENLEWSDRREETRGRKRERRWVRAWNLEGEYVGMWPSLGDASEATGVRVDLIKMCLFGSRKAAGGLIWTEA